MENINTPIDKIKSGIKDLSIIRHLIMMSLIITLNSSCEEKNVDIQNHETSTLLSKPIETKTQNILYADSVFNVADKEFDTMNYTVALDNYLKAYDIYFKKGEDKKAYWASSSIARIYLNSNMNMDALHYYERSLFHLKNINYIPGKFIIYTELLTLAANMDEPKIFDKYYNLGNSLFDGLDTDSVDTNIKKKYILFLSGAIDYLLKGDNNDDKIYAILNKIISISKDNLELMQILDNNKELLLISGKVKANEGLYDQALEYFDKIEADTADKNVSILKSMFYWKYAIYKILGKYEKALEYKELHDKYQTKIMNREKSLEITNLEAKYESSKKDQEIKTQRAEIKAKEAETQIAEGKAKRNKILLWAAGALLSIITGAGIFGVKKHKQTVKAKNESEKQKKIIEEQNKDKNASIRYAKKIQSAIMPDNRDINEIFPDNYIMYKPKDEVSGDFYFVKNFNNKKIFANFDATGHGVPGAIMSTIGLSTLRTSTKETKSPDSGLILQDLDKEIEDIFHKKVSRGEEMKDTMEGTICIYNEKTGILETSGSYGEFIIIPQCDDHNIKEGDINGFKIKEHILKYNNENIKYFTVKTQKLTIGSKEYRKEDEKFNILELDIGSNSIVSLYSDGFADQFGGEKGKKLKRPPLLKELVKQNSICTDLFKSGKAMENFLDQWKGDYEQIDDISIFSVRLEKKKET